MRPSRPFLAQAAALLFPIDWPEPFGLVMIEAMACGTPVIAYRSGSVPEVIDDGVTGFIVESEEEAVDAVNQLARLDRRKVRKRFEERFSAHRMARAYESHYRQTNRRDQHRTVDSDAWRVGGSAGVSNFRDEALRMTGKILWYVPDLGT